MGRAKTRTWLPLDLWAEWFGINPLHFNQLYSEDYPDDNCGEVWFQHAWHEKNQIAREDLARAIRSAEAAITDQVKYNLIPDWLFQKIKVPRLARPELYGAYNLNIRGQTRSLELPYGHYIAAGYQTKQALVTGTSIVRSDEDGDGYAETCTVTFATDQTAECQMRVYYPGEDGDDIWEIRPLDSVVIAGGACTITFKSWLIADPDLIEQGAAIDGDAAASYVSTVDVYRVYNNPSTQGSLIWEPIGGTLCGCGLSSCNACTVATQDACLTLRDQELGYIAYYPATYDADDGTWTAGELAQYRDADRIDVYYYSGWEDPFGSCPRRDMDPYWQEAVAKYAAGLLDRAVCSCNNSESFIDELRRDIAAVREGIVFQSSTESQIGNVFGTTVGAIFAWNRCNGKGRALPK
jgi:hypothetical protein